LRKRCHAQGMERDAMKEPEFVGDLEEAIGHDVHSVRKGDLISRALEQLVARPESRAVYVVDEQDKLVGVVSFRQLLRVINARKGVPGPGLFPLFANLRSLMPERVEEIMRPAERVHPDTPIREAFRILEEARQNDLPIVDAQGRIVGELNGMRVMRIGLRIFHETEAALKRERESR
jgi:CBS-domain-containing membrane protein